MEPKAAAVRPGALVAHPLVWAAAYLALAAVSLWAGSVVLLFFAAGASTGYSLSGAV